MVVLVVVVVVAVVVVVDLVFVVHWKIAVFIALVCFQEHQVYVGIHFLYIWEGVSELSSVVDHVSNCYLCSCVFGT